MDKLDIAGKHIQCSTVKALYKVCLDFDNIKTSITCGMLKQKFEVCNKNK
jgi:hypothetical protein